MGMPVIIEIIGKKIDPVIFKKSFDFFRAVDQKFSTYKKNSEISRINRGKILPADYSSEMKLIFQLASKTKQETNGYFNIQHQGKIDPSGVVKGWAINEVAKLARKLGCENYYIDAGGDIQTSGNRQQGIGNSQNKWRVGIKNPFKQEEIVKIVELSGEGIATSGTYIRGDHIYDPITGNTHISDIASLTVIAGNVFDADRFATAAYAMGRQGINFVDQTEGLEGYMIDATGTATMTRGFEKYV